MAHRDAASRFAMEPLEGPLTLTAAPPELFWSQQSQQSQQYPDVSDAEHFAAHEGAESAMNELMPVLSSEERELLLLVLQDAPIETDDSDAIEINGDNGSGDDTDSADGNSAEKAQEEPEESVESPGGGDWSNNTTRAGEQDTWTTGESGDATSTSGELAEAQGGQDKQQKPIVKVNPRRNRKRRKHEVDALRVEEKELLGKLKELQESIQQQKQQSTGERSQESGGGALVATSVGDSQSKSGQWIVIKKEKSPSLSSASIWESLAWFQREEARTAMKEHMRLRSVYQTQLLTLRHLVTSYNFHTQFPFNAELNSWLQELDTGALLTKRARVDPFDEDFAIFASLGHDFDAQYAKIDSIMESAGLAHFDGHWRQEMIPKRGANGIYFLESVLSKMIPREMHAHDQQLWEVLSSEELHAHHGVYEVRERTNDTMFRKIVNSIRLPNAEATLIRRTALRRYIQEHRIVVVSDTVLEITGSVSMRLRERGWKQLRRPHVVPPSHSSRPLSMEQACVRITPELSSIYSEEDIAAGSLTNAIVGSYRCHLKRMHHLNKDMFISKFEKLSIHGRCHHPHRHRKKHHHYPPPPASNGSLPPAPPLHKTGLGAKEHCPFTFMDHGQCTPANGALPKKCGKNGYPKLGRCVGHQLRACLELL